MDPGENGVHGSGPLGRPTRMILLGYYDGATDGLIQFNGPTGPVYRFVMPDEDEQLSRPFGTPREYTFSPLPADAMDRLEAGLSPFMTPERPVWGVNWQFPTPGDERTADALCEAILSGAGPVEWLVTLPWDWSFEEFRPIRVAAAQPA
jgi:hypothetical protein